MNDQQATARYDDAVTRYNTGDDLELSIKAWKREGVRPDVFITAPSIRDVGETELIAEFSRASYEVQGFRDARHRHFISRKYPYGAQEWLYARFIDQAFDTAEICDGFYGVDNIDLTQWVDKDLSLANAEWERLLEYVSDHPETDFVFIAYTDTPSHAEALARSLRENCGLALLQIDLNYPTREALVVSFNEASDNAFLCESAYVSKCIESLLAKQTAVNYAFISSCAVAALHELTICSDHHEALRETFERYETMTPKLSHRRIIGF